MMDTTQSKTPNSGAADRVNRHNKALHTPVAGDPHRRAQVPAAVCLFLVPDRHAGAPSANVA